MPDEIEYSESGNPIYRHAPRETTWEAPGGESALEEISTHVERHLGPIDFVYHEIVSDLVHIDVLHVAPRSGRNFHTLVTSGMSDRPMKVPPEADVSPYAELLLCLPREWPVSQEEFDRLKDEARYWPVRWLKMLARLPHEYQTWLGWGHTVPNGDPPEPFAADTKLCGVILLSPILTPTEFDTLRVSPDKEIHFWGVFPLYRQEMDLKLKRGSERLVELMGEGQVTEVLDIGRANLAPPSWWPFR
jgi:hypothetical protein